jgi:serine/threonine protein kinase/tetratricopeptide (TPR) repeat protein
MIGKTILHYKILAKLGGGGMGVVYKAEDTRLGRTVALKFLPPEWSRDEEAKGRFIQEAQAASRLDHPNICTIYDINETDDGRLFIAMAYYEGETLKKQVASGKATPVGLQVENIIDIAVQIAQGLSKAHEKGIIHRDIKPANVMITNDGVVKILDFGLAKFAGQSSFTKDGVTLGTVAYMSPEQTRGEPVDHRTDVWALGVVLYEMLTGQLPFKGEYEQAVMYSILHEEPEPLARFKADVSQELQRIVGKALEKDRETRYQHIDDLLTDLKREKKDDTKPSKPVATRWSKRRWMMIGIPALLLLLAGVWALWQFGSAPPPATPGSWTAIAVLPFSVQAGDELAYLQDGMVTLLSTNLDQAGVLRSIDPNAVLGSMGRDRRAVHDPQRGREIAARFRAAYFILGSVTKLGQQIQLNAFLYDAKGTLHEQAKEVAADENGLFAAIDALSREIIPGLLTDAGRQSLSVTAKTTTSLEALKAYLEGDWLIREGRWQEAIVALQRAVEEDSTFALAWNRLHEAIGWSELRDDQPTLDKTIQYRNKLPERMQKLVAAKAAWRNLPKAEALYREILSKYPEDATAWFGLGDLLNHHGWLFGRPLSESREPLERAQEHDYHPSNAEVRFHLAEIAFEERDLAMLDSLRALESGGKFRFAWWEVSYAAVRNDAEHLASLFKEMQNDARPHYVIYWAAIVLYKWLDDIPTAQRITALHTVSTTPNEYELRLQLLPGVWEVARGRLQAARAAYEAASSHKGTPLVMRVLDRMLPFYPNHLEELEALRNEVVQWDTTRAPLVSPALEPLHMGEHYVIKIYLSGLLNVQRGDDAAVQHAVTQLRSWADPATAAGRTAHALERTLTALVAWRREQTAATLTALDDAHLYPNHFEAAGAPIMAQALNRYLRAEALFAEERYEEALPWYETLAAGAFVGAPYLGPSFLRRAEIYERLRETDKAIDFYNRFLKLWEDCDPELRTWVEDAEQRLNRLLAGTRREL